MKLINFAGPPSSGKTSVILRLLEAMEINRDEVGAVKFDCLSSFDYQRYEEAGIKNVTGYSGKFCPDHFFVSNAEDAVRWGLRSGFSLLVTESAGLCNRCSPYINGIMSVCVIDNLSGVNTPRKIGPMLKFNELAGEKFTLSTKVTQLSGGQSRALMIADTAYMSLSPLVLIDEIENAGIDRIKAISVLAKNDKIVLIATHDPLLALSAGKRIVIKNGGILRVIETPPEEKVILSEIEKLDNTLSSLRSRLRSGQIIDRIEVNL